MHVRVDRVDWHVHPKINAMHLRVNALSVFEEYTGFGASGTFGKCWPGPGPMRCIGTFVVMGPPHKMHVHFYRVIPGVLNVCIYQRRCMQAL